MLGCLAGIILHVAGLKYQSLAPYVPVRVYLVHLCSFSATDMLTEVVMVVCLRVVLMMELLPRMVLSHPDG